MSRLQSYLGLIENVKRGDIDAVIEMMTDDIVFYAAVGMVGPMQGSAMVRQWLEGALGQQQDSKWRVTNALESGDTLFVEGIEEYTTPDGGHVVVPYAGVFEFRGEQICAWRDYLHGKLLRPASEEQPVKEHVLEFARLPAIEG